MSSSLNVAWLVPDTCDNLIIVLMVDANAFPLPLLTAFFMQLIGRCIMEGRVFVLSARMM
jgi:hypothetical protein